jgi:hypothetical protein
MKTNVKYQIIRVLLVLGTLLAWAIASGASRFTDM